MYLIEAETLHVELHDSNFTDGFQENNQVICKESNFKYISDIKIKI